MFHIVQHLSNFCTNHLCFGEEKCDLTGSNVIVCLALLLIANFKVLLKYVQHLIALIGTVQIKCIFLN